MSRINRTGESRANKFRDMYQLEKESRVQWQAFAYLGMNLVDLILERKGEGTTVDSFHADCAEAKLVIKRLRECQNQNLK